MKIITKYLIISLFITMFFLAFLKNPPIIKACYTSSQCNSGLNGECRGVQTYCPPSYWGSCTCTRSLFLQGDCAPIGSTFACWKTPKCTTLPGTCYYSGTSADCSASDPSAWNPWGACAHVPSGGCQHSRTCKYAFITQTQSCDCGTGGEVIPTATPTCNAYIEPNSTTVSIGTSQTLTAIMESIGNNGSVSSVSFQTSNTNASVSPSADSTDPYQTAVTGSIVGNSIVTASVFMGGTSSVCSAQSAINVTPAGPWWQAKNADISAGGNITSNIPSSATNPIFILDGLGGFPGIPSYTGLINFGASGLISSKLWSANSPSSSRRSYNYSFFARQIPSDTEITTIETSLIDGSIFESGGTLSNGAYWYKFTGTSSSDLTISSDINIGTRKVVLLIDGADLYLNSKVNLTDGEGFFMVIAGKKEDGSKGNIIIGSTVGGAANNIPELEGLFSSDGLFKTGLGVTQLHIRGSVAALGGITLERDLGDTDNTTTPAEYFEYAPDQVILMPSVLREKKFNWKEVAP